MIANNTIKTLSNKFQTTELNIRREYFQHLFLSYFYQQSQTEEIYFKGGTALRLFYNSPRFSEDLDFSSSLKNVHVIDQNMNEDKVLQKIHQTQARFHQEHEGLSWEQEAKLMNRLAKKVAKQYNYPVFPIPIICRKIFLF